MSTLVHARPNTDQSGSTTLVERFNLPMASVRVAAGAIAAVNAAGYLGAAGAAGFVDGATVVGIAQRTIDNASGNPGDERMDVERGAFWVDNSTGADAITQADLLKGVFCVDDHTVARTSALGTRLYAGRVVDIDPKRGVCVELGTHVDASSELVVLAGADLSTSQYFAVKIGAAGAAVLAGAGQFACGILQNAPANGAAAIIRVSGKSQMIAGAALATPGSPIASDASGKAKSAVLATTNTGDAGSGTDALTGSYVLGIQLTAAAGDLSPFRILITHSGAIATTAA